jgi:malonate-semialdehyde dehydrogenase (acetylating)/methylmalonate-semialdehyde dehydrogenase
MAYHSFGGWSRPSSAISTSTAPRGVRFYTHGKVITRRWSDPSHRGVDLGFPVAG